MQCLIVSQQVISAQPLFNALRRKNIQSICVRPKSLYGWRAETDGVVFCDEPNLNHYSHIEDFLDNLPQETPLIFVSNPGPLFKSYFSSILGRCLFLNSELSLTELTQLIEDVTSRVFNRYLDEYQCGPLRLNRHFREVDILGKRIKLTKKE